MNETLIHALLLEVKPLAVLSSWEPVGARLEALSGAIRGQGSVSDRDTTLLRSWARRWALLPPAVRDFYARHVQAEDSETARVVLWRILEGRRSEDWMVRKLERLWEQDSGVQPIGVDLAPLLR
jgi:hypothetical protein